MIAAGLWLVLTLAMFASAAVDLWIQTLVHMILMVLALGCLCFRWANKGLSGLRGPAMGMWVTVLLALSLSTWTSQSPAASQPVLANWFDYFLVFILTLELSTPERENLWDGLFLSWTVLVLWGLTQFLGESIGPQYAGFLNANGLAGYLLVPIALGLSRMRGQRRGRPYFTVFTIAAAALLLCTRSAGALLALGAAAGWTWRKDFLDSKKHRWTMTAVLLILSGIAAYKVFIHGDPHRWFWWRSAIRMALRYPVWGQGPGTYEMALPRLDTEHLFSLFAHNTFLQWWAEFGTVGLILIFGLLILSLKKTQNRAVLFGCLAVLFHNAVDYSLSFHATALLFWLLLASGRPERASPAFHRPIPRVYLVLACGLLFGITVIEFQNFRASRDAARSAYAFKTGNVQEARLLAEESIRKDPHPSSPYLILAQVALAESGGRGAYDQALAYALRGWSHEPINRSAWTLALDLYGLMNLPHEQHLMKQELIDRYPYLQHDKRLQNIL